MTSSDNSGIGSMDVKDYYLATVHASKSIPVGDGNASLGLTADLGSVPSTIKLDIVPVNTGTVDLPFDSSDFSSLLAFNMTRSSGGGEWPMKAGTVRMTLSLPLDELGGMDLNSTFYLLKNDGTRYIIYGVMPTIENGVAIFDVPLYYETNSPSNTGTFTLAGTRTRAAANATATPTPAPVQATPTPKATGSNATIFALVAALAIAAFFCSRGKKQ